MKALKHGLLYLGFLCVGLVMGGYLFSHSQPRSFLAINHCQNCLSHADLLGLIASVGIQRFPGLIPAVTFETDKTVALKIPSASNRPHYVIIPKKDIKDIGQFSEENAGYFIDALLVAKKIIEQEKFTKYRFFTNGPGLQEVTYLHFHLYAQFGQKRKGDTIDPKW